MFELLAEHSAQVLVELLRGVHTTADGSSLPDFLLHVLGPADGSVLAGKVSGKVLLGPTVALLLRTLGNGKAAVLAHADVRLAAILDGRTVLGHVLLARHVRNLQN